MDYSASKESLPISFFSVILVWAMHAIWMFKEWFQRMYMDTQDTKPFKQANTNLHVDGAIASELNLSLTQCLSLVNEMDLTLSQFTQ